MAKDAPSSLREQYSDYYRTTSAHDSPDESRARMARSLTEFIKKGKGIQNVLNVGSGRRDTEGTVGRNVKSASDDILRRRLARTNFISFDIADIPARRLIGGPGLHVQADSTMMPFRSEAFDLTFSNLSIDMLRRQPGDFERAIKEVSRVTKVGGAVLLNYHPPDLFEKLSNEYEGQLDFVADYYNGNEDDNPFYMDEDEIAEDLLAVDIIPSYITLMESRDGRDRWWEVYANRF